MLSRKRFGSAVRFVKYVALGALIVCGASLTYVQGQTGQPSASEPLPASQLVQPADFVRALASASADARPTIVHLGSRTLFAGVHIPGATFHGSPPTLQGFPRIQKCAAPLPQ